MKILIIPAVLENTFDNVCVQLDRYVELARRVQIDLVKWKPIGTEELPHWDIYDFEFDLLGQSDMETLEKVKDMGAAFVVWYLKSGESAEAAYQYCKQYEMQMAVCGSINDVLENLEHCDYVQLMGIDRVGFQGQAFREGVIDDIKKVSAASDKIIQIDGSMNEETIKKCFDAGATQFVVGSALKNTLDVVSTYRKLKNIVHS
jgi:pentose-5-phosphate-3-epimerase